MKNYVPYLDTLGLQQKGFYTRKSQCARKNRLQLLLLKWGEVYEGWIRWGM